MKVKSLLLSLSCVAALTASAQQSGSFVYKVSTHTDNWSEEAMNAEEAPATEGSSRLCTWFDSDFSFQIINHEDHTFTSSSIYTDAGGDMITTKFKCEKPENVVKLHGVYVKPELVGEILYVTVPSKYNNKGEEADVTEPGSIVFHITLGAKPARINDANNTWGAYLYEMSGAKIGIQAPAYAKAYASFGTPGVAYQGVKKSSQQAIVDFEITADNKYEEIKSITPPYNSNAVCDAETWEAWPSGYCCKFIDVVVSNVKVGDRIGFGGIQTLYPGCKEEELAGVSDAIADDANVNTPAVYYNLQGMEIANPSNGMFIKRQGNKVSKVVL